MDRLISLEPSNVVVIRIEHGHKCCGQLTLKNVMYTMPVAFRLQPVNKDRYVVRPQSGIISPLTTLTVEITYDFHQSGLPRLVPYCDDSFLLHSVVVPGAAVKNPSSTHDSVPNDWFTARKKQVFVDSGIKVMFVGSVVMASLVKNGCMDEIRDVLEKGDPSWRAVDSVDEEGQTLLHLAISQSRPDLVQLLLEFEPDIEARNRLGVTPLEAASASGEGLIVELLLAHRASTERSESSTWGPVHLAAHGGHVDVLRLLLLKGADINMVSKDGDTALHLAVEEQRRDCYRLLLASGARTDIRNSHDLDTPLHIAAALGDDYMVKLLLQKGAYKEIRNRSGKTAYDIAVERGHMKLFDALGLGDKLCIAARKGEARTIRKILESGAAVNGVDQHGWTALHRASFKGRAEAVKFLIEKGVDINARDEDGYTALHCAVESGHVDVLELLVKKGADVEARTNKGATAMQIAESLNYSGIKRVLVQGGASKDELTTQISKKAPAFANNNIGRSEKKKSRAKAAIRGSFDQSSGQLVVI